MDSAHCRPGASTPHQMRGPARAPPPGRAGDKGSRRRGRAPVSGPDGRSPSRARWMAATSGGIWATRAVASACGDGLVGRHPQAAHRGPEHRHRIPVRGGAPDQRDDVPRQPLGAAELAGELAQRRPVRQPSLQQQERRFLVAGPPGQVGHVIAAIRQPVVGRRHEDRWTSRRRWRRRAGERRSEGHRQKERPCWVGDE